MNFNINFSELVTADTNHRIVGYNNYISNTQRENCNTVIHLGSKNKSKTFNLCMNLQLTKKNVVWTLDN
jgi:hypothetical protein